ncbi:cystathionine beta-lyase [Chytridiales sp. JEL 0842]|nr:cystathionine beta-lyase [Chytridiales sp. JEL 0842]
MSPPPSSTPYPTPPHFTFNPDAPVSFYNESYTRLQSLKSKSLSELAASNASKNAADFFEYCVDRHGDLLAVKAVDFKASYTFNQLDVAANQVSHWARSAPVNLKTGDEVCLLMENRPEFLTFTTGFSKAGCTIALLNTNLTGSLLLHAIRTSGARVIVCSISKRENLLSAFREVLDEELKKRGLEVWWYAGKDVNVEAADVQVEGVRFFNLNPDILEKQKKERPGREWRSGLDERSPLFYIFTSGTTGPSKAAKFSHKRFIGAAVTWAGPSGLSKGDSYYITLPLYHGNAGVVAVAPCYYLGNTIVLREKFSASNFFKDIRDHNCVATIYIGELWRYLHLQPSSPRDNTPHFSPLRVIIGNGLRPEIWELICLRFGITQVVEHYGSTEMPGDAVLNYFNKPGSCGFLPLDVARAKSMTGEGGVLVKYDVEEDCVVRDKENGGWCVRCEAGEVGEMVMRLPGGVYDGYVGETATRRKLYENVFEHGDNWWSSGDLLTSDEQGFFYFVDRAGDSFRWKGENVSTNEVISVVSAFPGISECNVYGVKVPNTDGRAGMASIVLKEQDHKDFKFAEFSAHLSQSLPVYARPLFLRIRDTEHEKTSTLKFQKFKYVQQGFDPAKCEGDVVYMFDKKEWVVVDECLDIQATEPLLPHQIATMMAHTLAPTTTTTTTTATTAIPPAAEHLSFATVNASEKLSPNTLEDAAIPQSPTDSVSSTSTATAASSSLKSFSAAAAAAVPPPIPKKPSQYRLATQCCFVSQTGVRDPYGASATPIYQTATFKQNSASDMGEYDYTRSGNPTRSSLESHLAKLMKAHQAFATSTGMSALDTILRLVKSGQEIITGDDLYGGTNRLLNHMEKTMDIKVHHIDITNPSKNLPSLLKPGKTAMILLETPTNPMIKIADIRLISRLAKEVCGDEVLVVVDNTMMSPILMNTLELGADVEYHSGTKYLSGHHDLMAGVIAAKDASIAEKIAYYVNAVGCGLAPFDCFLLLRGVKTLALRVEKQQSNAQKIASYLQSRSYKVFYPGLATHPQHELHNQMAKGPGAVMSFVTGCTAKSRKIVEGTKIWGISVSFGCVNSLISMPCNMSHASIPAHIRAARELPEDLVRLCVGIEDPEDLIEDLGAALDAAEAAFEKSKKKKSSKVEKSIPSESPPKTTTSTSEDTPKAPSGRPMTAAELRFEEVRKQRAREKAAKMAAKSHKERVAEFNNYLDNLSEHHDIPRVGPG